MNALRRALNGNPLPARILASPALRMAVLILYTSRVGSEFLLPAQPLIGFLIGAALGITIAFFMRQYQGYALFLLLVYVLFPFQSPELALLTGITTCILALASRFELQNPQVEAGVFIVALVIYSLTLAPGVQPADGGEFQLVIAEWGVAHPPGYPLYTMLGGIFARMLPFQDIAWRTNLFSAVIAASTLGILARTVRQIGDSGWAGLIAAGILGTATAFWTTATQASIRPMTTLFMVLMISSALYYHHAVTTKNENGQTRALLGFALAAGFGVTHHASLLFPGSVLALGIVAARPALVLEPRKWGAALLVALSGALPWLYLLARGAAGAVLAPPSLTTWDGFWQHVLASGFAGDMFYYHTLPEIAERLRLVGEVLRFQWPTAVLLLACLAGVALLRRQRWVLATLGSAFVAHTLVTATYRAPQTVEYMLPAYVCIAALAGLGTSELLKQHGRHRIIGTVFLAATSAALIWAGWPSWVSLGAYQQYDVTAEQAADALESAPPDSTILANWHHVTPLWYIQGQSQLRPDVSPQYVAPAGSEPILDTWARLIEERANASQVVVTCAYYPETFRFTNLTYSASGPCWAATSSPGDLAQVEPEVSFGDHALLTFAVQDQIRAGTTLPITLTWQLDAPGPYGELTAFTHLVDADGVVVAQVDQPFMVTNSQETVRLQQRQVMHIPTTALPGEYRLMVGLYRQGIDGPQSLLDDTGSLRREVAQLAVTPATLPPVTAHPLHTPFSSQLRLIGYDYDLSVVGRARLYLHWQVIPTGEDEHTWHIVVNGQSNPLAAGSLTAQQTGGFISTAYDVPDTEAAKGLSISVSENGEQLSPRGAWNIPFQQAVHLSPVTPGQHYIQVGDVVITGYAIDPNRDDPGDIEVQLTMQSTVPQTRDISLKIETETEAAGGAPVGGMLPSLKWYWSATLRDTIMLAAPISEEPQVAITFYDASTSTTWPIFDPALGQTSPILRLPMR